MNQDATPQAPAVASKDSPLLLTGVLKVDDLEGIDVPVVFRRQPRVLLAEHRVSFRLALLVITLSQFRSATANVGSLNLIGWAVRTRRSRLMLKSWWDGHRYADTVTERIDPALPVTLNLAITHGLVRLLPTGHRVQLTELGASLASELNANPDLLVIEKDFLSSLAPLNDTRLSRLMTWEGPS